MSVHWSGRLSTYINICMCAECGEDISWSDKCNKVYDFVSIVITHVQRRIHRKSVECEMFLDVESL